MPSPPPLKLNDTLWFVPQAGQSSVMSDTDSLVRVVTIAEPNALLSNGAVINLATLRGFQVRTEVEDFGAVKEHQPPELQPYPEKWAHRKEEVTYHDPVRCWRSKADWMEHVVIQRAWNKLASRILQHRVDDMDRFTVDDIEAAELALFGNIEK